MRISDWSSDVCSSDLARADLAAFTHYNLSFANPDAEGRFVKEGRMTCMEGETGANLTVAALRGTVARLQAGGGKVLISTAGRSEGRRVGKEGVSTCRSRWSP